MDGFQIVRFILAALLVLLVPGCAIQAWLPKRRVDAGEGKDLLSTLADAAAISIALPALLALALFGTGVRVGGLFVGGLYGICLVLLLAASLRGKNLPWPDTRHWLGWVGALLFLAGLIAWRFYQARSLVLPAWVDSVHHTLIVRKMLEYGGLPPDLSPYLPGAFSYHYGFHVIAAIFAFWAGLSPDRAVLWFGQLINALVSLSVYRAAEAFTRGPAAGDAGISPENAGRPERTSCGDVARVIRQAAPMTAASLVNFDFQMPAYYLTWGRYTLLTGLLLLGPALAAALDILRKPQNRPAKVTLVILIAGLSVTHYFALLLEAMFLVVLGLFTLFKGFSDREHWRGLARLAGLAVLGILLASPWIWRVWVYNQQQASVLVVNPLDAGEAAQQSAAEYLKYLIYLIGPRRNYYLMGMAGVGLLAALLQPRLRPLAGWGLLLGLFSLPWGLRLGPFRPDHYSIVLFFPAAMLLAELIVSVAAAGWLAERITARVIAATENPRSEATGAIAATENPRSEVTGAIAATENPRAEVTGAVAATENPRADVTGAVAATENPRAEVTGAVAATENPRAEATGAGAAAGWQARPAAAAMALVLLTGLFVAWGIGDTGNILNSNTVFTVPADVSALKWVNTNIPATARFYINNIFWQGNAYRGMDGGYWLAPYTGRFSLVPPVLYATGPVDYVNQINDWAKRSEKLKGCSDDFWSLVREAKLTHVYIRQGKGNLQPGALAQCQGLKLVYEQGGVYIYEISAP